MTRRRLLGAALLLGLLLTPLPSCGTNEVIPGQAAGVQGEPDEGLLVTLDVKGDAFRTLVTREDAVQFALQWVQSHTQPTTVAGTVDQGSLFDDSYSWHLRSDSVTFNAQIDIEANCRARPGTFEAEGFWKDCVIYAPDGATITEVQDCRSGRCEVMTAANASPIPTYNPCSGKSCGDPCQVCPPTDPNCVETAVVKSCDSRGSCVSDQVTCA